MLLQTQMQFRPFQHCNNFEDVNDYFHIQTAFAFAFPFINDQIKFALLLHLGSPPFMFKTQHYYRLTLWVE